MARIVFETRRPGIHPADERYVERALWEAHIRRDGSAPAVSIYVTVPVHVAVDDASYEQAEKLLKETLVPRHDGEADANEEAGRYVYGLDGHLVRQTP